jgi:N-acetyl-anhydromuramyl-L-alanine amidase AmpD
MARYPSATWRPTSKHGYGGNDTHLKQGLVIHSAEGSLAGLFSVLDSSRQASWHFSMAQDGGVYQHVDTENIAWTNGSQESNTKFWGIECEGGGPGNFGEPLTEPQYQSLVSVVRWLWDTHGLTRYERQQTTWEHNEMTRFGASSTSCPSGRIPWQRLLADLEDDMALTEEQWKLIQDNHHHSCPSGRIPWQRLLADLEDDMALTEEQWKLIQDNHHHVHIMIPQLLKDFETRERARYAKLRKDIAAIGIEGGPTAEAIADELANRLRD